MVLAAVVVAGVQPANFWGQAAQAVQGEQITNLTLLTEQEAEEAEEAEMEILMLVAEQQEEPGRFMAAEAEVEEKE